MPLCVANTEIVNGKVVLGIYVYIMYTCGRNVYMHHNGMIEAIYYVWEGKSCNRACVGVW